MRPFRFTAVSMSLFDRAVRYEGGTMSLSIDPFVRMRLPNGTVPCREASLIGADDARHVRFWAESAASWGQAPAFGKARPSLALLDLAVCAVVRHDPNTGEVALEVSDELLLDFARARGPLFGYAPYASPAEGAALGPEAPFDEARSLWASAAIMANLATMAQECVNGALPVIAAQGALGNLVHLRIHHMEAEAGFDLYLISRPTTDAYAAWLEAPLFVRCERDVQTGRVHYGFILPGAHGGLDTVVATFDHEIATPDWHLLLRALELDTVTAACVRDQLAASGSELGLPLGDELAGELVSEELGVSQDDLAALAVLVRTLVAAHVRDARIDVFATGGDTGYFSFSSLLSWLWYDFSHDLASVRVKYCARCGRAFSVAGHRGPERDYCSAECRNAAHNRRFSSRRDDIRRAFLEDGLEVHDLARRYYSERDESQGCASVRDVLSSWPALKHAIDEAIEQDGWSAPLLKRCAAQGLDLMRLLPVRRQKQLRHLREQRTGGVVPPGARGDLK